MSGAGALTETTMRQRRWKSAEMVRRYTTAESAGTALQWMGGERAVGVKKPAETPEGDGRIRGQGVENAVNPLVLDLNSRWPLDFLLAEAVLGLCFPLADLETTPTPKTPGRRAQGAMSSQRWAGCLIGAGNNNPRQETGETEKSNAHTGNDEDAAERWDPLPEGRREL